MVKLQIGIFKILVQFHQGNQTYEELAMEEAKQRIVTRRDEGVSTCELML